MCGEHAGAEGMRDEERESGGGWAGDDGGGYAT